MADAVDELFWELAEPLMADGRVEEGQIMQSRCLRVAGEFAAMAEHRTGDLIVKLPAGRVADLISDGAGRPFAPAGKVFKEWVQVGGRNDAQWVALIEEAVSFAEDGGR